MGLCSNVGIRISTAELDGAVLFLEIGFFLSLMGDGEGSSSKKLARTVEMDNLSLDISSNRFSRDLLRSFMGSSNSSKYEAVIEKGGDDGDDEIQLNLGLSLGGRFGVDKSSNKLVRSSSVASCLPIVRDDNDVAAPPPVAHKALARTASLPVETEEEWRKRKELQTLRRMEAKRRRSEKQRNLRGEREGGGISRGGSLSIEERREIEVNMRERLEREKILAKRSHIGLSTWVAAAAAAASQALSRGGIDAAVGKGKGSCLGSSDHKVQGSVESRGGSSSGVSDLESKTLQGSSGEASPASIQSLREATNHEAGSSATKPREHTSRTAGSDLDSPSKRPDTSSRSKQRESGTSSLEDMPCVFTKGDGPNGRRVDGILYKYGKGEEVRIMCVCHGTFHSPAEFVKHAGVTDVNQPLKHIVVNPNSSAML